MFLFFKCHCFRRFKMKSLAHVYIWFRWYKKDNSPWWNYFTEYYIFQSYPPVLKYIDCIQMNWTSETRDISWDHMQFLESLLPKICLSKKQKKFASHKWPRIAQRRKKISRCQCRCVSFLFVVKKKLWTCPMLPLIVILAGLQYRKSAPCRYYPVS